MDDEINATIRRLKQLREQFDDGPKPRPGNEPMNEPMTPSKDLLQAAALNAAHVRLQTLQWARQRLTSAPDFPTARQQFDTEIAHARNTLANLADTQSQGPRIIIAPPIADKTLRPYIDCILDALGVEAYVSEQSSLMDFKPRDMSKTEFLVTLAKKLDVFIDPKDTRLTKVAEDMKKRG